MTPRGLDQRAVAAYTGVSVGVFMKLVADGLMPMPKLFGSLFLWDRHDIDRYFDARRSQLLDMSAWRELPKAGSAEGPIDAPRKDEPETYKHWYNMPAGPDRDRRMAKERDQQRARIRKTPLGKWERVALWELCRRRGKLVGADVMRRIGPQTHESLALRGYVSVRRNEGGQIRYLQINGAGIEALNGLPEEAPPQVREV